MAGKITELRFQKHDPQRVNVYLDGKFAFGLPDLEAAKLQPGQYLSDADVERLQELDVAQRAYDRAVRFLSYRPRSESEVRTNLTRAGTDPAVIDQVVARLLTHGFLNDAEFARFWIENRERFRPRGARALRQELRHKGVDDETAAEMLAGAGSDDSAYRAALPRAQRMAALLKSDPQSFRRKMSDFLLRRGFDYEVVRAVVTQLIKELAEEEDAS